MLAFGTLSNFSRLPALSFVLVRNPNDGAVGLHREEVENPVIVGVSNSYRFDRRQTRRQRTLLELSLAKIHEHVKFARAVDDRGVRIAVAVEISPGKSGHA